MKKTRKCTDHSLQKMYVFQWLHCITSMNYVDINYFHFLYGHLQAPKKLVRYHGSQVVTTKGERYHLVKKEEPDDMKKTYVSLKPARKYRFHWWKASCWWTIQSQPSLFLIFVSGYLTGNNWFGFYLNVSRSKCVFIYIHGAGGFDVWVNLLLCVISQQVSFSSPYTLLYLFFNYFFY